MSISAEASGQWIASGVLFNIFYFANVWIYLATLWHGNLARKAKRDKGCNVHLLCHCTQFQRFLMKQEIFHISTIY